MLNQNQATRLRDLIGDLRNRDSALTFAHACELARDCDCSLRDVEAAALDGGVVPERYSSNVGTLGLDGQRRLLAARVAVVGLGGLGGTVLEALGRLGFGQVTGVDPDAFEASNLNRQLLSNIGNLGTSKTAAAAARLAAVNPAVEFRDCSARFQALEDNVFADLDLVFDCLDSLPARRQLAGRCTALNLVLVHGAVAGWCGEVGVFPAGFEHIDRILGCGDRGAEAELGTLAVTAATAANLMVAKAVAVLTGTRSDTGPELLFFDLAANEWEPIPL